MLCETSFNSCSLTITESILSLFVCVCMCMCYAWHSSVPAAELEAAVESVLKIAVQWMVALERLVVGGSEAVAVVVLEVPAVAPSADGMVVAMGLQSHCTHTHTQTKRERIDSVIVSEQLLNDVSHNIDQ